MRFLSSTVLIVSRNQPFSSNKITALIITTPLIESPQRSILSGSAHPAPAYRRLPKPKCSLEIQYGKAIGRWKFLTAITAFALAIGGVLLYLCPSRVGFEVTELNFYVTALTKAQVKLLVVVISMDSAEFLPVDVSVIAKTADVILQVTLALWFGTWSILVLWERRWTSIQTA